ncbi:hypothetical protein DMH15_01145 [Streptomyces sp. WAC 06725]|uniref:hypothetical protein n=1 Tax=Streptomyces sp. WAC 06725 TaxID=2203209 RepID=UPI000F747825|nr:hypothetical protein [Streptomyces sp. WAC 06725]RSO50557.1 hypothetical protein DMH15_01145 [Streptomyces sp. WAC 06725]
MLPSATDTARAPVAREILRHYEKLLRPALDTWARELLTKWREVDTTPAADPGDLAIASAVLNKASFILAAAGHLDRALHLCHCHLSWVARLRRSGAGPGVLVHAVQPWINTGRLYALRADQRRAAPHFCLAERFSRRKAATLGPCELPADAWPAMLTADPDLPHVLWNTYALEHLKGSLGGGDGAEVLDTVARLRRDVPPQWHAFLTEGEILGLLYQGRAESALARAAEAPALSAYDESAFGLHEVTGLIQLGRTGQALHRARGLLAFLAHARPRPRSKDAPTVLRQLRHLGLLMEALNQPHYALAAALRGLDICATQDDQPLRLAFLSTALHLASHHSDAPDWAHQRRHLRDTSLYVGVRHGLGPDSPAPWDGTPFTDLVEAAEAAAANGG